MTNKYIGSFKLMKSLNKSLILNVIRTSEPISRAMIAKETKLTPPTVTNLVAELLADKLVIESEFGESTGGRKPIMLQINAEGFQVIGIDVGNSSIKMLATNLNADIIDSAQLNLPDKTTEKSFLELLEASIETFIAKNQLKKSQIIGIGIGMHGLVDSERGVAVFAPNYQLRNVPLRDYLEEKINLPVEVENDVRAFALGESWFGDGKGVENFVCINVGSGVGTGIFLNKRLYRGASFAAGEWGHTTISLDGPPCTCGNNGCLQAFISSSAITAEAQELIKKGRATLISELVNDQLETITSEDVYRAALQGDALAKELYAGVGRNLGIGLANIMNTLNPSKIIIGGSVSRAGDFFMSELKETVKKRALMTAVERTEIAISKLGNYAAAIGAVALVLSKLFLPDLTEQKY